MSRSIASPIRFTLPEETTGVEQIVIACSRSRLLLHRTYKRSLVILSTLILMSLFSAGGTAQTTSRAPAKIVAIAENRKGVNTTNEVTRRRHDTLKSEPATVPMDLEIGDELISKRSGQTVKVRCGRGAVAILSNVFHITVLRPKQNGDCDLYQRSKVGGGMNVKSSDTPTQIRTSPGGQGGETRLLSKRTRYEIKITPTGRKGLNSLLAAKETRQWLVYEGEVTVTGQLPRFSVTVKQGEKLVARGCDPPRIERITQDDIKQAAEVYARIDVSQAKISDQELEAAFLKLQALHQAVLGDPQNEQKQIDLVTEQNRLGIPVAGIPPDR